ncbi:hypothetical protein VIBNISFn118_140059 [Vibrio nigripulchritudo SFn118]|nr:hypothetical protein VIBNISFn118_140059 [Vibrio nigripulchritudo SFn118]
MNVVCSSALSSLKEPFFRMELMLFLLNAFPNIMARLKKIEMLIIIQMKLYNVSIIMITNNKILKIL